MRLLATFFLAAMAWAQDRPQFVWRGEVDGIAFLYLHANRLEVKVQEGAPVERQQFHFSHSLPEVRQDARLSVREGRGYVHIVDQPRLDNQYTLAVAIEDRQPGSSLYSIALYWDASSRFFEASRAEAKTDTATWSGRVDREAVISCQARSCVSSAGAGAPVAGERFKFTRPLPNRAVEVSLEGAQGRGEIRLVEQPSERNRYTARVSIRDPQAGAGDYSFTLAWSRSREKEAALLEAVGRGLVWTGGVRGRVRVTVRGGACVSQSLQGAAVEHERADFLRPLPSRSDLHPAIKTLRGAGHVEIVEVPSETNNYQLVFEIDGSGPAAGDYEIEVDW
ncbi:MAG TPA: hypothetical protein VEV17_12085 [Bryobacteraceae bacterium]|nr:hypothetical protein [Bryobacteraceae bacterium]